MKIGCKSAHQEEEEVSFVELSLAGGASSETTFPVPIGYLKSIS